MLDVTWSTPWLPHHLDSDRPRRSPHRPHIRHGHTLQDPPASAQLPSSETANHLAGAMIISASSSTWPKSGMTYLLDSAYWFLAGSRQHPQAHNCFHRGGWRCSPLCDHRCWSVQRPEWEEPQAVEWLAPVASLLDIDWESAMQAGIDRKHASEAGRTLSVSDSLLASLARQHDATLLTSDIKHYPMKDVRVLSLRDEAA